VKTGKRKEGEKVIRSSKDRLPDGGKGKEEKRDTSCNADQGEKKKGGE